MTVTLDLNADQEKSLRVAAEARGVDADTLAKEVMRKFLEEQVAAPASQGKGSGRLLGLNAMGVEWVSDDFDEPLPDSFWVSGLHAGRGWISDDFNAPLLENFVLGDNDPITPYPSDSNPRTYPVGTTVTDPNCRK